MRLSKIVPKLMASALLLCVAGGAVALDQDSESSALGTPKFEGKQTVRLGRTW